jgi:hypothetical protein
MDSYLFMEIHGGGMAVRLYIDATQYAEWLRSGDPAPCCSLDETLLLDFSRDSGHCDTLQATCHIKSL